MDASKLNSYRWINAVKVEDLKHDLDMSPVILAQVVSEAVGRINELKMNDSFMLKYSSINKLIGVHGYVCRFILNCRVRTKCTGETLSFEERNHARISLIRISQNSWFYDDILLIKSGKKISKRSQVRDLQPIVDDEGILRRDCRLKNSNLSFEQSYPIILHHSSPLAKLVIDDVHRNRLHSSVHDTMMSIRNQYWITKFRSSVRSVIHKCNKCRQHNQLQSSPEFSALPPERVKELDFVPFSSCGLDYVGPFKLKNDMKVYVLLFTCARIRAVHFEVYSGMDLGSFMNAFSLFMARRGCPKVIISDNFKTFQAAANAVKIQNGINWKFNAPAAPWHGGFFERMVKSLKSFLRKSAISTLRNCESFRTVVTKIEYLINSRPLTVIDSSFHQVVPLTPNDFLIYRGKFLCDTLDNSDKIRRMHIDSLKTYKCLWYRWRMEYLRMLKITNRKSNTRQLALNDLVILNEGNKYSFRICLRCGSIS